MKYIKSFPTPTKTSSNFQYSTGSYVGGSCVGDIASPSYILKVSSEEPGFEDWPFWTDGTDRTDYRCFSLK